MINLKNILVELEFKTPAEFAAYKKKHKMRPGTVVKVAGKDKKVGDDEPKSKKPKSDEPKSDEPKSDKAGTKVAIDSALKRFNNEVDLDSFEDNPDSFDALQDIADDLSDTPIGDDPEFRELYHDLGDNQDTESAENLKKYLDNKKISRVIFVKNKIINIIIKND